MDNSYFAKAVGILSHAARAPRHLPAYGRHLPAWGRQPIDYEIPWFSYRSLEFLQTFVKPSHQVFEYGGGGSTVWFARRARSVLTMESHREWHRTVCARLKEKQLTNASCELHELSGDFPAQFSQDSFFHRIASGTWDIILVDCYCGYSASRYGYTRPFAFNLALQHLQPGGIIILDDSWMYPELLVPRPGWKITDYVGLGPCRYGVTSTAILEKPL